MAEKLCLQWNDFKNNTIDAIGRLREDNDFSDVTLACEDGQQMEAHKVILAVSSPFFQRLLKKNKHPHPLIYMRGIKSEDLMSIINFLYQGEANVCQDDLDRFLAIAEELQLEGLTGQTNNDAEVKEEEATKINRKFQSYNKEPNVSKYPRHAPANQSPQIFGNENHLQKGTVALVNSSAGAMQALNEDINNLMEKSSGMSTDSKPTYRCKVCGKEATHANNMKKHIEAAHIEGVCIPCAQCEKTFRSRNALAKHIHYTHKQ